MLWSMGSQRVGHDLATDQQQKVGCLGHLRLWSTCTMEAGAQLVAAVVVRRGHTATLCDGQNWRGVETY